MLFATNKVRKRVNSFFIFMNCSINYDFVIADSQQISSCLNRVKNASA